MKKFYLFLLALFVLIGSGTSFAADKVYYLVGDAAFAGSETWNTAGDGYKFSGNTGTVTIEKFHVNGSGEFKIRESWTNNLTGWGWHIGKKDNGQNVTEVGKVVDLAWKTGDNDNRPNVGISIPAGDYKVTLNLNGPSIKFDEIKDDTNTNPASVQFYGTLSSADHKTWDGTKTNFTTNNAETGVYETTITLKSSGRSNPAPVAHYFRLYADGKDWGCTNGDKEIKSGTNDFGSAVTFTNTADNAYYFVGNEGDVATIRATWNATAKNFSVQVKVVSSTTEEPDDTEYVVYYYNPSDKNKDEAGSDAPYGIWAWDFGTNNVSWEDQHKWGTDTHPTLEFTNLYYYVSDDEYYPVYKYVFNYKGLEPGKFQINKSKSGDALVSSRAFVNNALFYGSNYKADGTYKLEPKRTIQQEDVYTYFLDGAAFNGWEKNDIQLLPVEGKDNTYSVKAKIKAGAFGVRSFKNGVQDTFYNAATEANNTFTNDTEIGKTYTQTLPMGTAKNFEGFNGGDNEYTFTFVAGDNKSLTIEGPGIKEVVVNPPADETPAAFYLRGINGDWNGDKVLKLAKTEAGKYTATFTSDKVDSQRFKIDENNADGQWGYELGAKDAATYDITGNATIKLKKAGSDDGLFVKKTNFKDVTFSLDITGTDPVLTVSFTEGEAPAPEVKNWGIRGAIFEGENDWANKAFTYEDGKYTLTTNFKKGQFGICVLNDQNTEVDGTWHNGLKGANTIETVDYAYTVVPESTENAANFTNNFTGTHTFVFDAVNMTLTVDPKTVVEQTGDAFTIYANIGGDYYNAGQTWTGKTPYVVLENANGTEYVEMSMITAEDDALLAGRPMFKATIDADYGYKLKGFAYKKGSDYEVKPANSVTPDDWKKYIWSLDGASGWQTFVTFRQLSDATKDYKSLETILGSDGKDVRKLYGLGDSFGGWYAYTNEGTMQWEGGVFIKPINQNFNDGSLEFKLSYIKPDTYKAKNNITYTYNKDMVGEDNGDKYYWANFNLGLVGGNDPKHASSAAEGQINGNVWIGQNVGTVFNNYQNYNWEISASHDEGLKVSANRWLIVDNINGAAAVTTFDPQPRIASVNVNTDVNGDPIIVTAPLENKLKVTDAINGYEFKNLKNGDVYITEVNTIGGTVNISASSVQEGTKPVAELFDLAYQILVNNDVITEFPAVSTIDHVDFPSLPFGTDITMGIRAIYYPKGYRADNTTEGTIFGSRINNYTPENVTLPATPKPEIILHEDETLGLFPAGKELGDAVVRFEFVPAQTTLASVGDFQITTTENKYAKSELLHADHSVMKYLSVTDQAKYVVTGYSPKCDTEEYTEGAHNWASLLTTAGSSAMSAYAPEVLKDKNTLVTVEGFAVYPFMMTADYSKIRVTCKDDNVYDGNGNKVSATTDQVRRRAKEAVNATASEVILAASAPAKAEASTGISDSHVSGIADVTLDSSADFELYNLQGVRVLGQPAPGLYIRRTATSAEKIYIR